MADLPRAVRLARLAWLADPAWGDGNLASLMGSFEAARPGGSPPQAAAYFDEALRLAREDHTIQTAILEARRIAGDETLAEKLNKRFRKEVVQKNHAAFIAAKLKERDERHARIGASRYMVEPNIKEGKGGLRDLHTLFWIAKYVYRVHDAADLVQQGVFDPQEYRTFRRCEDFLWSVRCNMHFYTGRPEERLSFEMQREIAQAGAAPTGRLRISFPVEPTLLLPAVCEFSEAYPQIDLDLEVQRASRGREPVAPAGDTLLPASITERLVLEPQGKAAQEVVPGRLIVRGSARRPASTSC